MKINHSALVLANSVVVTVDGSPLAVNDSHVAYHQIREAVRSKDWDAIPDLLNTTKAVESYIKDVDTARVKVTAEHGRVVVSYDDEEIKGNVSNRIIQMMKEEFDATPMVRFLENLMENPDKRASEDLLDWLEAGQMPITEDGYILAYKNVRTDFTDIRTGTFDNSPGQIVKERRNKCDPDANRTCSNGLHFCAQSYLKHYGGDRGKTVIVKIHPRDVVAFPKDYNLTKGRCCEYEVITEHTKGVENTAFKSTIVDQEYRGNVSDEGTIEGTIGIGSECTINEAMDYFGCSRSAVRKRCKRGHSARWAYYNKVEILE